MDDDGNAIFNLSGQFQVPPGGHGRVPEVNLILELKDIIFPKEGNYQFALLVDKDHKGIYSLHLNKVEAPMPGAE
jgi:hypothetical protein